MTDNVLDFSGAYVQGNKSHRFLYLSWAYNAGGWVKRIKMPLEDITREKVTGGKPLQGWKIV